MRFTLKIFNKLNNICLSTLFVFHTLNNCCSKIVDIRWWKQKKWKRDGVILEGSLKEGQDVVESFMNIEKRRIFKYFYGVVVHAHLQQVTVPWYFVKKDRKIDIRSWYLLSLPKANLSRTWLYSVSKLNEVGF